MLERFPKEHEEISFTIENFWLEENLETKEKQLTIKVLQIMGNTIGDLEVAISNKKEH
jgi:hypothetical protein